MLILLKKKMWRNLIVWIKVLKSLGDRRFVKRPLSSPTHLKTYCGSKHFPTLRVWWVVITTLYNSMLQSWHQNTAQPLVRNMLLHFLDAIHYRINSMTSWKHPQLQLTGLKIETGTVKVFFLYCKTVITTIRRII